MKDIDKLDLKLTKYKITKFLITVGNTEIDLDPRFIAAFRIEDEFDAYDFPFFEFTLTIHNKYYRLMKKNPNNIHVVLNIKIAQFKQDELGTGSTNPPETMFLAGKFLAQIPDSTPVLNPDLYEDIEEEMGVDKDENSLQNGTTLFMSLYNEDKLVSSNSLCNYVCTSTNLTDALTLQLNCAGFRDVLLSPATNDTMYHEFMLLPTKTNEAIEHICNDYGMHQEGTTIFHDFKYSYIIRKNGKCTAWHPNEYKKTYILYKPQITNARVYQGCCKDTDEKANYITTQSCHMLESSKYFDQEYATSFVVVDTKTGESVDVEANTTRFPKESTTAKRVIKVNSGDMKTKDATKAYIDQLASTWQFEIDSIDLEMLTPNKEFFVSFLDSTLAKYSGTYRIERYLAVFGKSDGEFYTGTVVAKFAKV